MAARSSTSSGRSKRPSTTRSTFGSALGLGQPAAQRVAAVKIVRPIGPDDEQSLAAGVPRQEGEQVARRSIRPLQVLDDEQDGRVIAEPTEQPQHALEDVDLEPVRVARRSGRVGHDVRQLGNQPGKLGQGRPGGVGDTARIDVADEGTQGFDDRAERESVVAEGDGATLEDEPAVVAQAVRDFRDEPGLPDARLTARRGPARRGRKPRRRPLRGVWATPESDRRRQGWRGAEPCRG